MHEDCAFIVHERIDNILSQSMLKLNYPQKISLFYDVFRASRSFMGIKWSIEASSLQSLELVNMNPNLEPKSQTFQRQHQLINLALLRERRNLWRNSTNPPTHLLRS